MNYLLSVLTTVLALVQFLKDWKSEKKSWLKLVSFGLIVLIGIGGIFNTYFTDLNNAKQRREDQQQIAELTGVQEANKRQSAEFFGIMLQKVSDLETQIKTEELQKTADQLRAELKATQKAMTPPKAKLRFTFEQPDGRSRILKRVTLPVKNDVVHVKFSVINESDVAALDGELTLRIPKACEFAIEPPNFNKLDGALATDRSFSFRRLLPRMQFESFGVDIKVPQRAESISVAVRSSCVNCVIDSWKVNEGIIILSR